MEISNKDLSLLISINDDIASIKDTQDLFQNIFSKIHNLYGLSIVGISLLEKEKDQIIFIIGKINDEKKILYSEVWFQIFANNSLPFELSEAIDKITYIDAEHFYFMRSQRDSQSSIKKVLEESGVKKFLLLPMKTGGETIGFMIFSENEYQINQNDFDYSLKIANLIGSAIRNVRNYEILRDKERERETQINLLLNLINIRDKNNVFVKLAEEIDKVISCEYLGLYANSSESTIAIAFSLVKDKVTNQYQIIPTTRSTSLVLKAITSKIEHKEGIDTLEISGDMFNSLCSQSSYIKQLNEKYSVNSFLVFQYALQKSGQLNLILGRKNPLSWIKMEDKLDLINSKTTTTFFARREIEMGINLLPQIGLILANIYAFEEIKTLTKKLEQEKSFLLDEINLSNSFQEIIGNSPAIVNSLNKVKQVAPLDATVLILGETGTGKELIAKAVHNLSKRNENVFITVNCAALPSQLIESELFGHEKGSFTGAVEKRIGKFEVANGGTIFLDEIGELPLEIQAKLLRVLQEKEFERIGGKTTIHSDIRIIAATNRDLEKEVEQGKFRSDLFFRLNVFPIVVPPLRERKEDIPLLVKYFINKYSKRIGKEVKSINKNDLDILMQYNWPGNIRELEHLIERSVIISKGTNLTFENLFNHTAVNSEENIESFKTLQEIEKEHIISALKITKGKVTGENSAAQLLGINGKTLGSRMRKLGIKREVIIKTN